VIQELKLNNNEEYDTDFVLSKSNIVKSYNLNHIESKKIEKIFRNLITFFSEFNVLNPPNIFQLAIKYIYLFVLY